MGKNQQKEQTLFASCNYVMFQVFFGQNDHSSTLRECTQILPATLDQPSRIVAIGARTKDNRNIGYGLIGATALVYLGLVILNARYKHNTYRAMTMIRGGLISLISDVTLLLDADTVKESAAITLMSTDVDRIVVVLEYSDFIWASPVEVAAALYLLNREIGLACVVPLGISLSKHLLLQL